MKHIEFLFSSESERNDRQNRDIPTLNSTRVTRRDNGDCIYASSAQPNVDPELFNQYLDQANIHNVNKLVIPFNDVRPVFRPELERIKDKSRITEIQFSVDADKNVLRGLTESTFAGFDGVTCFKPFWITSNAKTICWPHVFPNLKKLQELNARTFDVSEVAQGWPLLEYADFMRFQGNPCAMGRMENLTFLRLQGASVTDLKGMADCFPKLETLVITRQRHPVDLSLLSDMPALKNLRFDSALAEGLDDVVNSNLENMYFGQLLNTNVLKNNPQLKFLRTRKILDAPDSYALSRGWAKHASPIPGHEGYGIGDSIALPEPIEG